MNSNHTACPYCATPPDTRYEGAVHCKRCGYTYYYIPMRNEKKRTKIKNKKFIILTIIFLIFTSSVAWLFLINLERDDRNWIEEISHTPKDSSKPKKIAPDKVTSKTMIQFVEKVYQKPFSQINASDYERMHYLKVEQRDYDDDFLIFDYALDELDFMTTSGMMDYEVLANSKKVQRVSIPLERKKDELHQIPLYDFQCFRNLEVLDLKENKHIVDAFGYNDDYEYHLKNLNSLKVLYLGTIVNIERIPEIISNVENLKMVEGNVSRYEKFKSVLYRFEHLEHLEITELFEHETAQLDDLKELKELRSLRIPSVSDNLYLKELTNLKSLALDGRFQSYNLLILDELTHLEELHLINARKMDNISFISKLPNLKKFTVYDSAIKDISPLKDVKLESLNLSHNYQIEDYSVISSLKDLRYLTLEYWHVNTDTKLFKLSDLPNLKYLSVHSDWILALGKSNSMEDLHLTASNYEELYMENIPTMPNLKRLFFYDKGSLHNAKMLYKFPNLQRIEFYHSSLEHFDLAELFNLKNIQEIGFYGVKVFAIDLEELKENSTLKKLEMEKDTALYLLDGYNNIKEVKEYKVKDKKEIFKYLKALE